MLRWPGEGRETCMSEDDQGSDQKPRDDWKIRREPSAPSRDDAPGGTGSGPVFHIGCGTLSLAAIIGYPLGAVVAVAFFGEPGLGGFVGIFAMMLVLGFFNRRFQVMADRGARLPGVLGDRVFWGSIGIGAFVGFFFGPKVSGLLVGVVGGLVFYAVRRMLKR